MLLGNAKDGAIKLSCDASGVASPGMMLLASGCCHGRLRGRFPELIDGMLSRLILTFL
jgi:hypothetical protein